MAKESEALVVTSPEIINLTASLDQDVKERVIKKLGTFYHQAKEWDGKIMGLVVTDVEDTDKMKEAKTTRLALGKIRTSAEKIRKELKKKSLEEGKAIDAVGNLIKDTITPWEEHLKLQETFAEREEARIKNELRQEREELCLGLEEFMPDLNFGYLSVEDFEKLYKGAIAQKENKRIRDEEEAKIIAEQEEKARKEQEEKAKEVQRLKEEHALKMKKQNERLMELFKYGVEESDIDIDNLHSIPDEEYDQIALNAKNHYENVQRAKEASRLLNDKRFHELFPYKDFGTEVNLSLLHEYSKDEFNSILEEKKRACEQFKADKKRKEQEQANAKKSDRQRIKDYMQIFAEIESPKMESEEGKKLIANAQSLKDKIIVYLKNNLPNV